MTTPISLPSSAQGPFVARSGDQLLILDRDGDTGALLTRLDVSAERALSLGRGLIAAAEAVMSEAGPMAAAPVTPASVRDELARTAADFVREMPDAAASVLDRIRSHAAVPPEPPTDSAPVTVTVTPDPDSALGRIVGEPQEELTRVLGRLADALAELRARQGRDGARLALITGDFREVTAAEMRALRDRLPPDLFPGVTVRFGDRGSVHVGTGGRP